MPEDTIAALDGDWAEFTDKEKAAFALARKMTYQPHLVGRSDLDALKKHYSDTQVLGLITSIAGYNAMNRWTDGLAIPQEKTRDFTSTPISPKYKDKPSKVAVLLEKNGSLPAYARRPPTPNAADIARALADAKKRTSWLALASEDETRKLLPEGAEKEGLRNWMRLFALMKNGSGRIAGQLALRDKGNLDARLRAQIDWIAALDDRAWYALAQADQRLRGLGEKQAAISALAGPWDQFTEKERAVFHLVRVSTAYPQRVNDDDFTPLRKHFTNAQIAEIVHRVAAASSFNRVTEAIRLPVE